VASPPRSGELSGKPSADRRPARGRAAEQAAADLLRRAGLRIVARNVRLAGAEIDIVADDGDALVFVEVRSRSDSRRGGPLATVGREKQARIARAALAFLARTGRSDAPARFDVVGVEWRDGRAECTHVRGAFESPW
jgi:putative endonuclease